MILKKRSFLALSMATLLGVISCVFDDTENASAWMSQSGIPTSTKPELVSIDNVKPDSVWFVRDTLSRLNSYTLSLGQANGIRQEIVFDLLTIGKDSAAMEWLQEGDSSWVNLTLSLDSTFLAKMPQGDSLPFLDDIQAHFAWKLYSGVSEKMSDTIVPNEIDMDTLALQVLSGHSQWDTASVSVSLSFANITSSATIRLPNALQKAFQEAEKGDFYLQLKVQFGDADRIYRFAGQDSRSSLRPQIGFHRVLGDSSESYQGLKDSTGFEIRYFQLGYVYESSASTLQLHGGAPESLYVDFPEDLVFSTIQKQLVDTLALREDQIDSLLTGHFVLLASMDIESDTGKTTSELGIPLLVYSYSVVDTIDAAGVIGFTEEYNSAHEPRSMIDSLNIVKNGRANTLFWSKRDTLQLQITNAVRYWLQSYHYGAKLRVKMNISSWPILEADRYSTANYYDTDSNLVQVVSAYPAYSRWEMGTLEDLRFRIRIWLTEKR